MKAKADYSILDEAIKTRISEGKNTFMLIDGGDVYEEANRLSQVTGSKAFRIIDRRLQALRKGGVINYSTKNKWTMS
ncbi:hypothetical protein CYR40_05680 [Chimaeribacter arupi]|nr:hypothetical protein CYR40_05680 [Chimaeribacter arupi]